MQPPTKDQTDIGLDNVVTDCGNLPDTARQEFKNDADIHYMLQKFGVVQARGAPTYGEWDDAIDLQQAIEAVEIAQMAYHELPENLRQKFTSMEELLTALNNGSLVINSDNPPIAETKKTIPAEQPATPPAEQPA